MLLKEKYHHNPPLSLTKEFAIKIQSVPIKAGWCFVTNFVKEIIQIIALSTVTQGKGLQLSTKTSLIFVREGLPALKQFLTFPL